MFKTNIYLNKNKKAYSNNEIKLLKLLSFFKIEKIKDKRLNLL